MEPVPRRRLKVDLSELETAFDQHDSQLSFYLDLETGEVIPVSSETRIQLETLLEEYGEGEVEIPALIAGLDIQDWEIDTLLEAYRVEVGFGERCLQVPSSSSRQGYEDMQDFVETVRDQALHTRLEWALSGRGPFRAFKNALSGFPRERERWYAFRDERVRRRVLDWLETEGIEPVLE